MINQYYFDLVDIDLIQNYKLSRSKNNIWRIEDNDIITYDHNGKKIFVRSII
jgi:hypothetical protein